MSTPVRRAVLLLALAAAPAVAALDPSTPVPPDPEVRTGVLPNGMTYFVRANPLPEDRVELRLAVKVGSVQEEEAERGIAHFVEHMNFNGTANFEPGELVDYLESIGARFGADSNAYTSYDETVYFLQVPTDKPGALDKGLVILADWAGRATMSGEEIDKERGVVADELRGRKGAWKRILDKQDEVFFHGSRYAQRSTIGLEEVILEAPHDVVRGFYRRWYRPENIAVAVIGDLDPEAMEAKVREVFGALPASSERVAIPDFPVPPHEETLYSVESDKELTSSRVSIRFKHPPLRERTVGDVRRSLVRWVATSSLGQRLDEKRESADPPFVNASAGAGGYVRTLDVFTLSAQAREGQVARAAGALMEELERALQHGFTQPELERAKAEIETWVETFWADREKRRSRERIGGLVQAFLNDETSPGDEFTYRTTLDLLPGITLEEVNAQLRALADTKSRVVLVQTPDGKAPTVDEVRAAVEPEAGRKVEAYVDDLAGRKLVDAAPEPGGVRSRHAIPEVGVEEIVLGNGLRLVIKETDFRNEQVLMSGFAWGGAALLPEQDREEALRADTLVDESGLGEFSRPQLQKLLAGKQVGLQASIATFSRSFGGGARPEDFETLLQLVNLSFTQPRFSEEAYARMMDREAEAVRNALSSPQGVYGRAVNEVIFAGHPLFMADTLEEVQALDMAAMERSWRELFDDASEWTFVVVGNVEIDRDLPALERWLGSIPTSSAENVAEHGRPAAPDLGIEFPFEPAERLVAKGIEDQARTTYAIFAPYSAQPEEQLALDALTELLRIRLRERLREERGDTYGVGVFATSLEPEAPHGRIQVSFGSSPETRGAMMRDVLDELRRARRESPSRDEVAKIKELRYKALADGLKENGWWMGQLYGSYWLDRDPREIAAERDRIDRIRPATVHATARRWIDFDRTAEVVLVPEGWGPFAWMGPPAPPAAPAEEQPAAEASGG